MTSPDPGAAAATWDNQRAKIWLDRVDSLEEQLLPISDALFEQAALRPGERVLDVGCGSGATTGQAFAAVQPGGRVTGIDISDAMIGAARARVAENGIDWVVADAGSYPFEPATYDTVISRFGVMFFSDPAAAFANFGRACRPGGRLAMAVWCMREQAPIFNIPYQVVTATLDRLGASYVPLPSDVGPFGFGDEPYVRSILDAGGWVDVDVRVDNRTLHLGGTSSVASAVETVIDLGPASALVQGQPPQVVTAVRTALTAEFEQLHDGAGVAVSGGFKIISARRP
jgi:SAM-dependent methyltransferase